jgi:hypothetical protein
MTLREIAVLIAVTTAPAAFYFCIALAALYLGDHHRP